MVAESLDKDNCRGENSSTTDYGKYKDFKKWTTRIQLSLLIEAENNFSNIKGKERIFNEFLRDEFKFISSRNISQEIKSESESFSEQFNQYPDISLPKRRRLVVSARQFIHALSKKLEPKGVETVRKIKLKSQDNGISINQLSKKIDKNITLKSPLSLIKGIGPKIIERLGGMGIFLISDLLEHYPRDYVDYSALKRIDELVEGETATVVATVRRSSGFISPKNTNLAILELQLFDITGRLKVTRFLAGRRFSNKAYLHSQIRLFPSGTIVAVSGLVKKGKYGKVLNDPLIEIMQNKNSVLNSKKIGQLLPVYSLTEGITADRFREFIINVLPFTYLVHESLDASRRNALGLISKQEALIAIHRPIDQMGLQKARRRIVFEEFLVLQLGLLRRRSKIKSCLAPVLDLSKQKDNLVSKFFELLPFSLTQSQRRVISEIQNDISCSKPMARLLQGDVGSGKTVVALAALMHVVDSGFQGALMAPTEVLAEQHYRNFCKWLPYLHVNVELLTGSTTKSRRTKLLNDLANGSLQLLVGTHALIEDPVSFLRLGLVVVDEQHRFGVKQRNRLLSKGFQPHLLAMTATPIPRTLALSIYGDLDVSQIDELPPGRTPVKTILLSGSERRKAYQLIKEKVLKGQRAYVVLPLVEESEKLDLRSAVEVHKFLSNEIFPDFKVGLLHGRMNSLDKQSIICEFAEGECQILVSTTVVEVGVDVPEATVMVIDNADRFGLAQLHQLRGRVGRGSNQSYCLLINENKNPLANQRLEVLVSSNDGFEISEIDLRLRGPGQVLGTRQSGLPDLALASLADDSEILVEARKEAKLILENDPELAHHKVLKILLEEQRQNLSSNGNLN